RRDRGPSATRDERELALRGSAGGRPVGRNEREDPLDPGPALRLVRSERQDEEERRRGPRRQGARPQEEGSRERLEEAERRLVGPVDVLDGERERARLRRADQEVRDAVVHESPVVLARRLAPLGGGGDPGEERLELGRELAGEDRDRRVRESGALARRALVL